MGRPDASRQSQVQPLAQNNHIEPSRGAASPGAVLKLAAARQSPGVLLALPDRAHPHLLQGTMITPAASMRDRQWQAAAGWSSQPLHLEAITWYGAGLSHLCSPSQPLKDTIPSRATAGSSMHWPARVCPLDTHLGCCWPSLALLPPQTPLRHSPQSPAELPQQSTPHLHTSQGKMPQSAALVAPNDGTSSGEGDKHNG